MNQRTMLFIAAALTAAVLVIGGAIVGNVSSLITSVPAAPPKAEVQPEVANDREAEYQRLISEANARIEAANARLAKAQQREQALAQQIQQSQAAQPVAQNSQAVSYAISAEQAIALVSAQVPGARLIADPTLVDFEGRAAYEIALDRGMVYVDANNGSILYTAVQPAAGPRGDDDDHDEHGDDDHEEHEDDD